MSAEIKNLNTSKPVRSTKEVQQDYQNLAFKAGNLQYEIHCKNGDLERLNNEMRDLNFEYIEAKNREDGEAKAKAEANQSSQEPKNA
jgi:hypothetical protein